MAKLQWDKYGDRLYETGVAKGVLYVPGEEPVVWNGLTAVNEEPSGAEPTPLYADNIKYLNVFSPEEFSGTIESYTYPTLFEECDGSKTLDSGARVGQQTRKEFGFSYQTIRGSDAESDDYGYLLHIVYGVKAAPSSKSYATKNDTPEATQFSWSINSNPQELEGFDPFSTITIDSTRVSPADLKRIEDVLYGTDTTNPRLPDPSELSDFFFTAP